MADRAKIVALLEQVKQATDGDRCLDAELDCTFSAPTRQPRHTGEYVNWHRYYPGFIKTPQGFVRARYNTSSMDAALALLKQVLPGVMWMAGNLGQGSFCQLLVPEGAGRPAYQGPRINACTVPLALIAALLTALTELGESTEMEQTSE